MQSIALKDALLRRPQVEALTGLSRSALYLLIKTGQFPGPVRLGQRSVAWRESAVQLWISSRPSTTPPSDRVSG